MKTTYAATLVLSLAALAVGQANAMSSAHLSRDQVRAALEQAQRSGNIQAIGDRQGRALNELNPSNYPAKVVAQGKTRAQVQAELEDAIRTGDIHSLGDHQGRKLNEIYPSRYPAKEATTGITRAHVQAELAEAIRTGDIHRWDKQGRKLNELYPQRYADKSAVFASDAPEQAANDTSSLTR